MKKAISMALVCAMLGTTFAQYAAAEAVVQEPVAEVQEQAAPAPDQELPTEGVDASVSEDVELPAEDVELPEAETAQDPEALPQEEPELAEEEIVAADDAAQMPSGEQPEILDESGDILSISIEEVGEGPVAAAETEAEAETPEVTGSYTYEGVTFKYTVIAGEDEQGAVEITGMIPAGTSVTDLRIPATILVDGEEKKVTEIGEMAFINRKFAGRLVLPEGLVKIGDSAFEECGFSKELTIPGTVTSIGTKAFRKCAFAELRLATAVSLSEISEKAFEECTGLAGKLEIPANITRIGNSSFKGCTGITALALPAQMKIIGDSAFEGCTGLQGTLTAAAGITTIGSSAFKGCIGLTGLNLSGAAGLSQIGESAFEGCTGLRHGTQTINGVVWNYSKFAVPASVVYIGLNAFKDCAGLKGELDLSGLASPYIGAGAFSTCGFDTRLILPADCTRVDANAFFSSLRLSDVETIEMQAGDTVQLPAVYVGDTSLRVMNQIKWQVQIFSTANNTYVTANGGYSIDDDEEYGSSMTVYSAGQYRVAARGYLNDAQSETAALTIVVTARSAARDNIAPTVKWVDYDATVMKPGAISLAMSVVEEDMGIRTLTGYFCKEGNPAMQIPFDFDWSASPVLTSANLGSKGELSVKVPSSVEVGKYYLGGMTMTDIVGNTKTYAYDGTAKVWKNEKGYKEKLSTSGTLTVKDGFGYNDDGFESYITHKDSVTERLGDLYCSTAYIRYDAANHTVPADWFGAIKAEDIRLVLSDDTILWSIWGMDIPAKAAVKDADCLVKLAAADTSIYGNAEASILVQIPGIATFPGKASVRIRADQMGGLYDQTKNIFVYAVNPDNTLTKLELPVEYMLDNEQYWYQFDVSGATPAQLLMSGYELALVPSYNVQKIDLSSTTLRLRKGAISTLTAAVTPVGALNKTVTWSSSNKKVAKVSTSGKVTAKNYGKAVITARAADGSGVVAKCTVIVGYKIKYKLNGGKNNKNNIKVYYKEKVKLKKPTRSGYTFAGWYTDSKFSHKITKIPKSYKKNITLYAKWTKK